ncbi:transposase [Streptomyces sp. NPDC057362]|uniref:transposase n=1 Tax=Streptomyces sp. NPDC057362 TaxID=3346106 RepID=UPI00362D2967
MERFAEFADARGRKYPAIVKLWECAWEEFTPFLRFDAEIRRIACAANVIESLNPTGKGQARWIMRWKTALNAFEITFDGRLSVARQ